ncbi:f-box domain-containing protein [Ophiostoma piceae UAMH 11346]|uniref:F-box domain-containing protein n=1 Tax=Ophiostoma piceae (strain UAMH 11346) TaxID=1262450 RepID=S3C6V2_OPHP1|nr:f-box domain-containing protein [Ophiostoma piceae UAMH 11346]
MRSTIIRRRCASVVRLQLAESTQQQHYNSTTTSTTTAPPHSYLTDPLYPSSFHFTTLAAVVLGPTIRAPSTAGIDLTSDKTHIDTALGSSAQTAIIMNTDTPLFNLPNELFYNILSRLPPQDLALLSATCRVLYHHASDDRLWQAIVQDNVPGIDVASATLPLPITSFRELFLAHHPHWFLPRHKVWIGSESMAGKIVITRYDPRRACIEGYQLLAVKKDGPTGSPEVSALAEHDLFVSESDANADLNNQTVHVFSFEPDIHIHLDRPILNLDPWLAAPAQEQHDDAGPKFTFVNQDGPRPARPLRRTSTPSSRRDNAALPSAWVRPITMESGTVQNMNRMARQFLYARILAPEDERRGGTFHLLHELREDLPTAVSTELALSSCWPAPFSYEQLGAPPFLILPPRTTSASRNLDHIHLPYGMYRVWPPPNVPTQIPGSSAEHRVRCITARERTAYLRDEDYPRSISQVSDRAFHICSWMEPLHNWAMGVNNLPPAPGIGVGMGVGGNNDGPGASIMAEYTRMHAFSTIDPFYYTPTADKPFRGIWVGDYGGHGCEFLLIHQPETPHDVQGQDTGIAPQLETETDEAYATRRQHSRIYRGSLEAIKLTGDPNVPRGEYSFFAADLSAGRIMQKGQFAGARIVDSEGHVAGHGFRNDRFVASRLIIVSADRLAQFWTGSGYISHFHRVDIDRYTRPY